METKTMRLDLEGIHEYQQNRAPYLMVDQVEELIPGERAKGYKDLTEEEWFFKVHFPGDPNMPGMLQIEALVQIGALIVLALPGNKGKVAYLANAEKVNFKRKVIPGDRLQLECTLNSFKRGLARISGSGFVNGELACQADFVLVLPHITNNFKVLST